MKHFTNNPYHYLVSVLLALAASAAAGLAQESSTDGPDLPLLGKIKARSAKEISSSSWSIGGETLDRDFAVYTNYKKYLGPLGAKAIRLQGGWAKCEKTPGVYSWAWLDEIVNDALEQGVHPWIETAYGNPIYPDGGGTGLGGGMPKSPESLAAWDNWVRALVRRYRDRVHEWEIWNEPDISKTNTPDEYAGLFLRTAAIIRAEQPQARIYALALAGNFSFAETFLKRVQETGKVDLMDAVTIHGYPKNPDDTSNVDKMRKLLAKYAPAATARQGETGAPSGKTVGALRDVPWTEVKQAKWDLRRMLAHHGKDVPFNLFTLCELKYSQPNMSGFNRKGLLRCNDDLTVAGPKPAYFAAQRVFSIFDDTLVRIRDFKFTTPSDEKIAVFAYRKKGGSRPPGAMIVTIWLSGAPPTDSNKTTPVEFTFPGAKFTEPVYADLVTGKVHEFPRDRWSANGGSVTFKQMPICDSPVLIAEKTALRLVPKETR